MKWKRKIIIYNIEIISFKYPKLSLKAEVSAWTYIRSIAADLWEILWTGGYISKLRRTKIWKFDIKNAKNIDDIKLEDRVEEIEIFDKIFFISLEQDLLDKINNWLQIKWNFDFPVNSDLFVFNGKNIINIVNYDWQYLKPIRKI